jgi:TRAP-type C4-dicarboxylate transport system permease large subunit
VTYLTPEEALAIALEHAGVTADDIRLESSESDRDGGRGQYEIEFHVGRTEYDYDIDAKDGTVLRDGMPFAFVVYDCEGDETRASISYKDLIPMLCSSVKTYGGLAFVLAFATAFGRVLSLTRATKVVENFILGNFHSATAVLSVCVVVFLILGMVMDTGPAIIILAPVLLPAVEALGVDSVHFGVVLVCCLSIGLATPPFGLDMFVAGNLAEEPPMGVAKSSLPFIVAFLIALALITYVPWFSTFLVSLL